MFLFLLTAFALSLKAQTHLVTPSQLTLIHPDDQEFETLLNNNFPGLELLDGYAIFRPYLVLLRNDTSHPVRAYMMGWERQSRSLARPQPVNAVMDKYDPAPAVARVSLAPGDLRLVAPGIDVSSTEWQSTHQHNWVVTRMSNDQNHLPFSLTDTTSVNSYVDAVFDDGTCVGADHHRFFERYQSELNAERDLSEQLLRMMDAKSPEADIIALLKSEAAGTQSEGSAFFQRRHAQTFLTLYRRSGIATVMTRAWAITQHPPLRLACVSPQ